MQDSCNDYKVEVCASSVQSALNAQRAGAYRVELCDGLSLGGITPSYGTIVIARKNLSIKLNVLIRPRSGDFLYSDLEFETIVEDIKMAKQLGADGVVCGILNADGTIDIQRTKKLVEVARPMSFTFHRAFDMAKDPIKALEDVIATGADKLLTSGQQPSAVDGVPLLQRLVEIAKDRITIMPGSGINPENISHLLKTGAKEFHLSGLHHIESRMEFQKREVPMSTTPPDDFELQETSIEKVEEVIKQLEFVH